jgi:hypothetical protein
MGNPVARVVSIAGHPVVLMALAAVIASPPHVRPVALVVWLVCASAVLGYSLYKAYRGDWVHIDASVPAERSQLNSRMGIGLLAAAGVLSITGLHAAFSLVVALSGLIVVIGHVLRSVAKLSLHVAFAVFAAFLVWPNNIAAVTLVGAAAGIAWSRLALRRHVASDIILGMLAGAAAGLAFHLAMPRLTA